MIPQHEVLLLESCTVIQTYLNHDCKNPELDQPKSNLPLHRDEGQLIYYYQKKQTKQQKFKLSLFSKKL